MTAMLWGWRLDKRGPFDFTSSSMDNVPQD